MRSQRSLRLVATVVITLALAGLTFFAILPSHVKVQLNSSEFLLPNPGYAWTSPNNPFDWRVQWSTGTPDPSHPNIIASLEPGKWRPAPGYSWEDEARSQKVIWVPAKRDPEFPHVSTSSEEGKWILDPGYSFTSSATSITPHAVWQPNLRYQRDFPHIETSSKEGSWILDSGYSFTSDATTLNPRVAWSPGELHSEHPHVVAGTQENQWFTEPNFGWVNPGNKNDWRVFSKTEMVEAWDSMAVIDSSIKNFNCSAEGGLMSALSFTKGEYHSINLSNLHPILEAHIANASSLLDQAYATLDNCVVASQATSAIRVGAEVYCFLNPDKCDKNAGPVIEINEHADDTAEVICLGNLKDIRAQLDALAEDRYSIQSFFQEKYNMRLGRPTELFTCVR